MKNILIPLCSKLKYLSFVPDKRLTWNPQPNQNTYCNLKWTFITYDEDSKKIGVESLFC